MKQDWFPPELRAEAVRQAGKYAASAEVLTGLVRALRDNRLRKVWSSLLGRPYDGVATASLGEYAAPMIEVVWEWENLQERRVPWFEPMGYAVFTSGFVDEHAGSAAAAGADVYSPEELKGWLNLAVRTYRKVDRKAAARFREVEGEFYDPSSYDGLIEAKLSGERPWDCAGPDLVRPDAVVVDEGPWSVADGEIRGRPAYGELYRLIEDPYGDGVAGELMLTQPVSSGQGRAVGVQLLYRLPVAEADGSGGVRASRGDDGAVRYEAARQITLHYQPLTADPDHAALLDRARRTAETAQEVSGPEADGRRFEVDGVNFRMAIPDAATGVAADALLAEVPAPSQEILMSQDHESGFENQLVAAVGPELLDRSHPHAVAAAFFGRCADVLGSEMRGREPAPLYYRWADLAWPGCLARDWSGPGHGFENGLAALGYWRPSMEADGIEPFDDGDRFVIGRFDPRYRSGLSVPVQVYSRQEFCGWLRWTVAAVVDRWPDRRDPLDRIERRYYEPEAVDGLIAAKLAGARPWDHPLPVR